MSGDTPEQMKTNRYMEKDQCARGGAADRLRRTRDGREGVADGEWHAQEEHFNHVLGRLHSTPYAINQVVHDDFFVLVSKAKPSDTGAN